MLIEIIFAVSGILYAILILWFTHGWYQLPVFWPGEAHSARFSIVVALRNEEANIVKLLDTLRRQKYCEKKFEVLLVNDFSTDSTPHLITQRLATGMYPNFRLISLADFTDKSGKKSAITIGIQHSEFDWIITTDADCIFGQHWLQSFAGFINSEKPDMVIGPVVVVAEANLFSQMQSLEFMSLSGVTAGSAAVGRAVMCNGANLAFRKELFNKVGGYHDNNRFASGDDMFLLQKFKKLNNTRISYLKSHGAIAYTRPKATLFEFFSQRGRWAGKAHGYHDGFTIFAGSVVAAINLLILSGVIAGFLVSNNLLLTALFLLVFKATADFLLLYSFSAYLQKRELMWLYPALALIYPVYVATALAMGFLIKPKWKS